MVSTDLAQQAWAVLEQVPDPEIPVVSIRELGILREVNTRSDGHLEVVITPTYSGCPAMGQIEDDVRAALAGAGIAADIVTRLGPAWTTDWITEPGRAKLRAFGIAPPQPTQAHSPASPQNSSAAQVLQFMRRSAASVVDCPHCGSDNTTETSHFGSTACKALYKCLDCLEPFDYFKPY